MREKAYIRPPEKIPFFLKLGLMVSRKATKKDLLAPKLLAWYPKVAISSGVMESLVAHGRKDLSPRILQLVRMQASILPACPFCIDMNSFEYDRKNISEEEINALAGRVPLDEVTTFTRQERLAVAYTKLISKTPVLITDSFMEEIKSAFSEREIVILASTAAQVNYWARLISALGVPPAGFTDRCEL